KSTRRRGLCYGSTGRTWTCTRTCEMSDQLTLLPSTSSAGASPARTSAWLDAVRDWLASGADCSTSSCASLLSSLPVGFSSRTSLAFCRPMEDGTWEPSSGRWQNSGMGGPTACLTFSTSESPNGAVASSLSDVLEDSVHPKYFLSPKACRGILRRAEKRGKELPAALKAALLARASQDGGATE